MNQEFWKDKKVLVTGHTGFKGGWTCLLLNKFNSEVFGLSLEAKGNTNFYQAAKVSSAMSQEFFQDINDFKAVNNIISEIAPDVIIHMAAQSLVKESYENPIATFTTNIIGTVNLFEAIRQLKNECAIVNVTSDKCYENQEWHWPYREDEPMGGHDPYSCSKGCSELVTNSYRNSFFTSSNIKLASGRAGNVIGGGDWAENRLIPDIFRAHEKNDPIIIRSPDAIRPWQFVLEPVAGYLLLAEKLYLEGEQYSEGWNFGPSENSVQTVLWIVKYFLAQLSSSCEIKVEDAKLHEAKLLKLDWNKAKAELGWMPRMDINSCLSWTAQWYAAYQNGSDMHAFSLDQLDQFIALKNDQ